MWYLFLLSLYSAKCPPKGSSLKTKIPCTPIYVDEEFVEKAVNSTNLVHKCRVTLIFSFFFKVFILFSKFNERYCLFFFFFFGGGGGGSATVRL